MLIICRLDYEAEDRYKPFCERVPGLVATWRSRQVR